MSPRPPRPPRSPVTPLPVTELFTEVTDARELARRAVAEARALRAAVDARSEIARAKNSLLRTGSSWLQGGSPTSPRSGGGSRRAASRGDDAEARSALEARLRELNMPERWEVQVLELVRENGGSALEPADTREVREAEGEPRDATAPVEDLSVVTISATLAGPPGYPIDDRSALEERIAKCEAALRAVKLCPPGAAAPAPPPEVPTGEWCLFGCGGGLPFDACGTSPVSYDVQPTDYCAGDRERTLSSNGGAAWDWDDVLAPRPPPQAATPERGQDL